MKKGYQKPTLVKREKLGDLKLRLLFRAETMSVILKSRWPLSRHPSYCLPYMTPGICPSSTEPTELPIAASSGPAAGAGGGVRPPGLTGKRRDGSPAGEV